MNTFARVRINGDEIKLRKSSQLKAAYYVHSHPQVQPIDGCFGHIPPTMKYKMHAGN
jgi:hypothetical protein